MGTAPPGPRGGGGPKNPAGVASRQEDGQRSAAESQWRYGDRPPWPAWGGEPYDPGGVPRPLGRSGRGIRRLVSERLVFPDGFGVLTGMICLDALDPRGRWT